MPPLPEPTDDFVTQLLDLCNRRMNCHLLGQDWVYTLPDDAAVHHFMDGVRITAQSPLDTDMLKARVKEAIGKFPKRFLEEVNACCSSNAVSIHFCTTNELTLAEYRRRQKRYSIHDCSGWRGFGSSILYLNRQLFESDEDVFRGILFHELAHFVLQISRDSALFNELKDADLRDDECVFLGGCLMEGETRSYLEFMTKSDFCTEDQLERDVELLMRASQIYKERRIDEG